MKTLHTALFLALLAGCGEKDDDDASGGDVSTDDSGSADGSDGADGADGDSGGSDGTGPTDADGDGWSEDEDCDDTNADIRPDADERCDDVDWNCDGDPELGAVDAQVGWIDNDGDGYGDAEASLEACVLPDDAVDNPDDCDDSDDGVSPGAAEICDGAVDEDCDGDVDEADSDIDACEAASWDGSYTGSFDMVVTVTTSGITDTCSGSGVTTVDSSASTQVVTEITCAFSGVVGTLLPGTHVVDVEGNFDTPNTASGTVTLPGLGSDTWSGTFASPGAFEATMSGTQTVSGFDVSYSGTYTGTR